MATKMAAMDAPGERPAIYPEFEAALERDRFMTAQDATDWGLIDEIVDKRPTEATAA